MNIHNCASLIFFFTPMMISSFYICLRSSKSLLIGVCMIVIVYDLTDWNRYICIEYSESLKKIDTPSLIAKYSSMFKDCILFFFSCCHYCCCFLIMFAKFNLDLIHFKLNAFNSFIHSFSLFWLQSVVVYLRFHFLSIFSSLAAIYIDFRPLAKPDILELQTKLNPNIPIDI